MKSKKGMKKILVVDDERHTQELLQMCLEKADYSVRLAASGKEALELVKSHSFAVALVDLKMPEMDGFTLIEKLHQRCVNLGIIVISAWDETRAMISAEQLGIDSFITKPVKLDHLLRTIERLIHARGMRLSRGCRTCKNRERLEVELDKAHIESIYLLAKAAEAKDDDIGPHVKRIQFIVEEIALALGFPPGYAKMMGISSIMHDVGKMYIPDKILQKKSRLSPDEWKIMRQHSLFGVEILGEHFFYETARQIAGSHHENWNGSGYPNKLSGNAIPLPGRITAVADVWDALTHKRCYKEAWPEEKAVKEMRRLAGKKFDPEILKVFIELQAGDQSRQTLEKFETV